MVTFEDLLFELTQVGETESQLFLKKLLKRNNSYLSGSEMVAERKRQGGNGKGILVIKILFNGVKLKVIRKFYNRVKCSIVFFIY